MNVLTLFATHKNNLNDAEGRDYFTLATFDISKNSWKKHLHETFQNNSEEVVVVISEIEKMNADTEAFPKKKHLEINDVYIWVNISQIW